MQQAIRTASALIHKHLAAAKKPLIVILGPTASGKTAVSVDLALAIKDAQPHGWTDAEILNADSRQLYRGLDIGTAKATMKERRGVTHYLFDLFDPSEEVTAPKFQTAATTAIDEVLKKHHVPILCGGSMLYLSAVVDGLTFAGKSDPAVRQRLSDEYDLDEGLTLQKRLCEMDPEAAENTERRNKVYMLRAMEIAEQAGSVRRAKTKSDSPYDVLMIGLRWNRDELTKRINDRTPKLVNGGWIDEVKSLKAKGYSSKDPGMISHGYREILKWIEAGEDPEALPAVTEKIAAMTRQYAKRQMTWWKRDERIQWIDRE